MAIGSTFTAESQGPVACAAGVGPRIAAPLNPQASTPKPQSPTPDHLRQGPRSVRPRARAAQAGTRGSTRRSGAVTKTPGADRRYGMVPPGSVAVEPDGRVNFAMVDLHWAGIDEFAAVRIDAAVHRLDLSQAHTYHPPSTVFAVRRHRFNGSAELHRLLRMIGVDPRKAAHATITVTRIRHGEHGPRSLLLCFPAETAKDRAPKNKRPHHEGAKSVEAESQRRLTRSPATGITRTTHHHGATP